MLAPCPWETARTPPSFRVSANTHSRVSKAAVRDRSEPMAFSNDFSPFEAGDHWVESSASARRLDELAQWVRRRGHGFRGTPPSRGDDPTRWRVVYQ